MERPETPSVLETAIYATDLAAAKQFYGNVIGLRVITEVAGRHVFFDLGASVLLIFNPDMTKHAVGDVPAHGARGPGHICFSVDGSSIESWRRYLTGADVAIESDVTWPNGARSFYLRDPAGNSVEFAEASLWFG